MKKDIIRFSLIVGIPFMCGVILTVFVYQAWVIYQIRAQVINDHTTLMQVVDFLNKGIQSQQAQVQQQAQ